MKIISFYNNERRLIKGASQNNREAQQLLYTKYAPKMLSVCRQYIKDLHFAEDVMVNGFVKVFAHLSSFKFEGNFEGWIRRIMIRESISFLRKKQFVVFDDDLCKDVVQENFSIDPEINVERIQKLIDQLPEGYKMVFVMYVVEGYKHAEIADMLGVSESTSKSQLFKARKILQEKLIAQNKLSYGTN